MVICLEQGADLHMFQLMPLPLAVSCFSKIQIGFTFLVLAHPGSPGKRAVKRVCVCVCVVGDTPSFGSTITKINRCLGVECHLMLTLHMAYQCTKFKIPVLAISKIS